MQDRIGGGKTRTQIFKKLAFGITLLLIPAARNVPAQAQFVDLDSDNDGMSDALEQALLVQFAPTFMVARHDCSKLPAEFAADQETPTIKIEDGTIYGQVSPTKASKGTEPAAEIHFYHLWRSDCGPHGHPLDTEHVAVLVTASDRDLATAKWKALYWYAAAHEDTVCDVSQITRASTLHAEQNGATVFVSSGKHASYLDQRLCHAGCGADRCVDQRPLARGAIVNLGEPRHPMNGSVFIASTEWPLLGKMSISNFTAEPLARLNHLPDTDIAWFNPGKHPTQGIIATSNTTSQAIANGANSTGVAISLANDSTGNALQKTYKNTKHALGVSAKHVGDALNPPPKTEKPK